MVQLLLLFNLSKYLAYYFKKIILEDLETDTTWKICTKCDVEYKNKSRTFEKINYVVPEKDLCFFHKK